MITAQNFQIGTVIKGRRTGLELGTVIDIDGQWLLAKSAVGEEFPIEMDRVLPIDAAPVDWPV